MVACPCERSGASSRYPDVRNAISASWACHTEDVA